MPTRRRTSPKPHSPTRKHSPQRHSALKWLKGCIKIAGNWLCPSRTRRKSPSPALAPNYRPSRYFSPAVFPSSPRNTRRPTTPYRVRTPSPEYYRARTPSPPFMDPNRPGYINYSKLGIPESSADNGLNPVKTRTSISHDPHAMVIDPKY